MKKHHPENERIKHRYMTFLREAKRQSEPSIDKAMAAIASFESYTRYKPFKAFDIRQATGFKHHLAQRLGKHSNKPLSAATMNSTLSSMRTFVIWLADQPGYKARISYSDAEYFNISEKERSVATARREQPVPDVDQILHVLRSMPGDTDVKRRDRALLAFTFLTGARDGSLASFKLKHVDLPKRRVYHDAREVRTKASKTFETVFFPVDDFVLEVVAEWIAFLRTEKLWGQDDPLFPATDVKVGVDCRFGVVGLTRKHWSNANPIRRIFREAFEQAGLPYFNPHSFRKTLAQLGERLCRTPEEFKAWSQNLGHEQVLTTFVSYGQVDSRRQAEILMALGSSRDLDDDILGQLEQFVASAKGRK
jgi:integrase